PRKQFRSARSDRASRRRGDPRELAPSLSLVSVRGRRGIRRAGVSDRTRVEARGGAHLELRARGGDELPDAAGLAHWTPVTRADRVAVGRADAPGRGRHEAREPIATAREVRHVVARVTGLAVAADHARE